MGDCRYRVFLKKWPRPQTGVHLRELSANGRCPLVGVRLYNNTLHDQEDEYPVLKESPQEQKNSIAVDTCMCIPIF